MNLAGARFRQLLVALAAMGWCSRLAHIGIVSVLSVYATWATPAIALELDEALALAYLHDPRLQSARFKLAGVDERVSEAWAAWKPRASAVAGGGYTWSTTQTSSSGAFSQDTGPVAVLSMQFTQLVYDYSAVSGVRQSKRAVEAQRAALQDNEQMVLLDAADEFLDVVAAKARLASAQENLDSLQFDVAGAQRRQNQGLTTESPVIEAKARVAAANAAVAEASMRLVNSRESLTAIIGSPPSELTKPAFPSSVPATLDEVLAEQEAHPAIVAAKLAGQAAEEAVNVLIGETLPRVIVRSDVDLRRQSILGLVQIPLYQPTGYPKVRAAKQDVLKLREELEAVRRRVRLRAVTAWQLLQSSRIGTQSLEAEVKSSAAAVERIRREQSLGLRSITDLLTNQANLEDARTKLVVAQANTIRAGFQILEAMGRLTARDLSLDVPFYDPTKHYNDVSGKWIGYGDPLR